MPRRCVLRCGGGPRPTCQPQDRRHPTVSLLVASIGAGSRTWRRWAKRNGHAVVSAPENLFPHVEWARAVADQVDLPAAAVRSLALRVSQDPDQFQAAWRAKTPADCERH